MNRRDVLLKTGALAAGAMLPADALAAGALPPRGPLAAAARLGNGAPGAGAGGSVALVRDPADRVAGAVPVQRAVVRLRRALATRGYAVRLLDRPGDAHPDERVLVVAGASSALARATGVTAPAEPESLALAPARLGEREVTVAASGDARGLVFALAEIADAVALGQEPAAALRPAQPKLERPANRVRSVMRLFVSDVEDLPWYTDRGFWRTYLARLVDQRFNRVNLALGLGYDTPEDLADTYFYFAYPFLVDAHNVRATYLPTRQRDRNLELLRFASDEAAAVGLDFQLGLWTHAYQWVNSPHANHVIEGLLPSAHAVYCRDALEMLLRQCPNITGVTIRIHGESGVPEGSYGFWRTVFDACTRAGRPVKLDLHAKGLDQPTLDAALGVGVPLTISPKFWAEHMGLPYHQAAIRPTELPGAAPGRGGAFLHSEGDRSFTRYGYGDLLREDRRYAVVERLWPGTQRVLLWGDPAFAAAYARASSFCGIDGCELMEPLSFKGRKGSGTKAGRDGYADATLRPPGEDFEKYELTYRLWGRLLYDPDAPPEVWQRRLRADYGAAAPAVETALSRASRILPLLTTAHLPSAANNHFWPEMYVNMAIADPNEPVMPYPDTPQPRRFGTVSPLDPQLFSTVEEFAGELLAGPPSGKYSPVEVAQWLEDLAAAAGDALADRAPAASGDAVASGDVTTRAAPAFRRLAVDTGAAIGLGRFFAGKLRAAVLFALYDRTGDRAAQVAAVRTYQAARDEYARVATLTTGVYVPDLTYGPAWYQRGHWQDRLPAIDGDISAVRMAAATASTPTPPERMAALVAEVLGKPERPAAPASHTPPASFGPGQSVLLSLTLPGGADPRRAITLHYRITHQAEAWRSIPMAAQGDVATAAIPGDYTDTPYPLQYYFEIAEPSGRAWLYPGLGSDLTRQPYFVVRRRR